MPTALFEPGFRQNMEELRSTLDDYGGMMDSGRLRGVLLSIVECLLVAFLLSPRVSEADELHWAAVVLISDPPHAAVYSGGEDLGITGGLPATEDSLAYDWSCTCDSRVLTFTFRKSGYKPTTKSVAVDFKCTTRMATRAAASRNGCLTLVYVTLSR